MRRSRRGGRSRRRPRGRAEGAGRRRGPDRRRRPRHSTTSAPRRIGDDPAITPDKVMFHGQVLFVVLAETRDAALPGAEARPHRHRHRGIDAAHRPSTMRSSSGRQPTSIPTTSFSRGDTTDEISRGAARRHRRVPDRRAGALLPRRPGRARRARRGRRHAPSTPRPSTRARCSTSSPMCSGSMANQPDGRGAPHGRRLRRQGEPGDAVGACSPRLARGRPAGRSRCGSIATTT
jgi:hypothetical protein